MADSHEELKARLKAAGVDPSEWGPMGGKGPQTPRFALRMANDLQKVQDMLTAAMEGKQAEVKVLQERLIHLKYGGGS